MKRRTASAPIRWSPAAVAALLFVVFSLAAWGHKPLSIDAGPYPDPAHALPVEEIDVSQVVYGELTAAAPTLWLSLEGKAGDPLHLSLGVPVIDRLRAFRPALALVGPGLPAASVPFAVPEGLGVSILTPDSEPAFFPEPFTGTDSWILRDADLPLPVTGRYYVVAYSPIQEAGKLWVAIGTREAFGFKDFLTLPSVARDVRAFHEVAGLPRWLEGVRLSFLSLFVLTTWWFVAR